MFTKYRIQKMSRFLNGIGEYFVKSNFQPIFFCITPFNIFHTVISSNFFRKKKRSVNDAEQEEEVIYPFMKRILQIGPYEFMKNPQCQKKLFCEMSVKGQEFDANWVQKSMHFATIL